MKAKITISQGTEKLFTGTLVANDKHYEYGDTLKEFAEDLFNIERYINTQGAYRCHIELEAEKGQS